MFLTNELKLRNTPTLLCNVAPSKPLLGPNLEGKPTRMIHRTLKKKHTFISNLRSKYTNSGISHWLCSVTASPWKQKSSQLQGLELLCTPNGFTQFMRSSRWMALLCTQGGESSYSSMKWPRRREVSKTKNTPLNPHGSAVRGDRWSGGKGGRR